MMYHKVLMYHKTKFGCKLFSHFCKVWDEQLFSEELNSHCDLEFEGSNPIFHMTVWLVVTDVPLHQAQ